MVSFRAPVLAWAVSPDDEVRFRRILHRVLGATVVACVALPWLPVMQPDRSQPQELPPRLARLMLEREATPLPPPPAPPSANPKPDRVKEEAVATPSTVPAPQPKPRSEPAPRPLPVPEARNPQPDKPAGEIGTDAARRKAAGVGLLAMSSELAEIRGAPLAVQHRMGVDAEAGHQRRHRIGRTVDGAVGLGQRAAQVAGARWDDRAQAGRDHEVRHQRTLVVTAGRAVQHQHRVALAAVEVFDAAEGGVGEPGVHGQALSL